MVMTIDEMLEELTEMKKEIGGDAMLVMAKDTSNYVSQIEIGYAPEVTGPYYCNECPNLVMKDHDEAKAHERAEHGHQHTTGMEDIGPPEPDVVLVTLGDFADDAEEHYERMMDR